MSSADEINICFNIGDDLYTSEAPESNNEVMKTAVEKVLLKYRRTFLGIKVSIASTIVSSWTPSVVENVHEGKMVKDARVHLLMKSYTKVKQGRKSQHKNVTAGI